MDLLHKNNWESNWFSSVYLSYFFNPNRLIYENPFSDVLQTGKWTWQYHRAEENNIYNCNEKNALEVTQITKTTKIKKKIRLSLLHFNFLCVCLTFWSINIECAWKTMISQLYHLWITFNGIQNILFLFLSSQVGQSNVWC